MTLSKVKKKKKTVIFKHYEICRDVGSNKIPSLGLETHCRCKKMTAFLILHCDVTVKHFLEPFF